MLPDVLLVLAIMEIMWQWSLRLPAIMSSCEPLWESCLQGTLFTDGDVLRGAYMLIYGTVLPATLLRSRIYGRVLTFRRSSDLSTGFGMYHNKQWMEYGEKLVPQLLLTSKVSRKWLTQNKILNLRQEVRFNWSRWYKKTYNQETCLTGRSF